MSVAERQLQVVSSNPLNQFPPEKVDLIRNTVAKGTTNDELEMFLYLAAQYQLDPFKKEIWCIKYDKNSAATIMTSRDGYLKIAKQDINYDGLKSFVVREGDTFEIDAMNDQVIHKFGSQRGKIIGAWAIAYHKELKPQIAFVDFSEYNQGTSIWKKYPSAMIQKVAEAFVLKRQFGINGLVTQEEMPVIQIEHEENKPVHKTNKPVSKDEWVNKAKELHDIAESAGVDGQALREIGQALFQKEDPKKWSVTDMDKLIEYLSQPAKPAQTDSEIDLPADEDLTF